MAGGGGGGVTHGTPRRRFGGVRHPPPHPRSPGRWGGIALRRCPRTPRVSATSGGGGGPAGFRGVVAGAGGEERRAGSASPAPGTLPFPRRGRRIPPQTPLCLPGGRPAGAGEPHSRHAAPPPTVAGRKRGGRGEQPHPRGRCSALPGWFVGCRWVPRVREGFASLFPVGLTPKMDETRSPPHGRQTPRPATGTRAGFSSSQPRSSWVCP